jgi:hypothetical protein
MNPVNAGSAALYSSPAAKPQSAETKAVNSSTAPHAKAASDLKSSPELKVERDGKVSLSKEGKALLAALQDVEKQEAAAKEKDKTVGDKVESFTYGALGMKHPDQIKETEDDSYSAGQYLSAAATVGAILLAIV